MTTNVSLIPSNLTTTSGNQPPYPISALWTIAHDAQVESGTASFCYQLPTGWTFTLATFVVPTGTGTWNTYSTVPRVGVSVPVGDQGALGSISVSNFQDAALYILVKNTNGTNELFGVGLLLTVTNTATGVMVTSPDPQIVLPPRLNP